MPGFMLKPGYCEHCGVKYEQFHEHVKSALHLSYARDDSVFAELDKLLAELKREEKDPDEMMETVESEDNDDGDSDGVSDSDESDGSFHGSESGRDSEGDSEVSLRESDV